MLVNTRTMALARTAFPCLARHGIAATAFKGPFHQHQLYGDYFYRPSNDLDMLVPRARFEDALAALAGIGFTVRRGTSQWWKFSLGEVHLDYQGGGVIDLHHRLQQPGCPAPRDLTEFLEAPQVEWLGEAPIAIPPLEQALLISALNFCKELFHRKPSARYAFDFAAGALRLGAKEQAGFAALVRRQGMEGPVDFTTAACRAMFGTLPGLPGPFGSGPDSSKRIDVAMLSLTPDDSLARWPRRRALLWEFCGGEANVRCSTEFARQAGRVMVGELLRRTAPATDRVRMA